MGYKVNAQNVMSNKKWYKQILNFCVGYSFIFLIQMLFVYNYLSYINQHGVDNNETLLAFVSSLFYIFSKESFSYGFSLDILNNMFKVFSNLWLEQIILILLVSLAVSKIGKFKGVEYGSARWGNKNERKLLNGKRRKKAKEKIQLIKDLLAVFKKTDNDDYNISTDKPIIRGFFKRIINCSFIRKILKVKEIIKCFNMPKGYPIQHKLYADNHIKELKNLNELVIGDTGAGKTFKKLDAELMQMTGNYVVVDVKGALYKYNAKYLKENGYKIRILNLKERSFTNTYNPLAYIKTQDDIDQLAETFIINSRKEDGKQSDEFWESTMEMLLKSILSYLIEMPNEDKTFARVLDLVRSLQVVNGEISSFSEYAGLITDLKTKQPYHSAVINYDLFTQAPTETLQSILISFSSRLRLWTTEEIRILTTSEEMDIEGLTTEKTAIFINIPSKTGAYKVISSMFITQLFDRLYSIADDKFGAKLKIPVNILLDEFANCGAIPKFDSIISTCRSYNIRCVICIQNKQQLEKLYDKAEKTIMSNCCIWNYLGTSDSDTLKMFVERIGKTTINEQNLSRNVGSGKGGGSESDRSLARELLTIDELNRLPPTKSIICISGFYPFFGQKFKTQKHPLYKKLGYDDNVNPNNTYVEVEYEQLSLEHRADYFKYKSNAMQFNEPISQVAENDNSNAGGGRSKKRSNADVVEQEQAHISNVNDEESIRGECEEFIPQQDADIREKMKNKML